MKGYRIRAKNKSEAGYYTLVPTSDAMICRQYREWPFSISQRLYQRYHNYGDGF